MNTSWGALIVAVVLAGAGCDDHGGRCCPPSATFSSCMDLGGYSTAGCGETCDFWCATNFRTEVDSHGCPVIRYDVRAPAPGENSLCFPVPDAGADAPGG